MRLNVDLETGDVFFLQQTLESEYLSGRYGALPLINWELVGGRPFKAEFVKVAAKVTDKRKLAAQLRKVAKEIEGVPDDAA